MYGHCVVDVGSSRGMLCLLIGGLLRSNKKTQQLAFAVFRPSMFSSKYYTRGVCSGLDFFEMAGQEGQYSC